MTVNQLTPKGIINWQGFSIGKGGSVFFDNGSGATLNRVIGPDISTIAGLLNATGSVYLINPQGIVITNTGSVITGGDFIASTLNISDANFLSNNFIFSGATGMVANEGSISSSGSVVLVGTAVMNSGSILSPLGTASLVSTTRLVLIPKNGLSGVVISPSSVPGNVTNSGIIKAASIYLSSSGGNIYALAGNNGGLIEATGTKVINGQVWLTAPKGTVSVNLNIKSANAGGSGGNIFIDGLNTSLGSSSYLYAPYGNVKIGIFPGLPKSLSTTISSGASIIAPYGTVETSGETLNMGDITVKAASWLLDPVDFTIDSSNDTAIDDALNSGDNVSIITTASAATGTDATTSSPISNGTSGTGTSGDINVDAPVLWSTGSALILDAYNNMNVNSNITASGQGELVLDYGNYYETHSAIPGTSLNVTGSFLGFTQTSAQGYPTGAAFVNGVTQELVVLGVFSNGVIYPSHEWCVMPKLPLPPNEMVLAVYYPTVTPPNNNPTNVPQTQNTNNVNSNEQQNTPYDYDYFDIGYLQGMSGIKFKVKVPEKEKSNYEWGKKIGELQRKSREGASNPELGGGNGSPKIGNPPKPPVTPKQPVVVPLPTPDTIPPNIFDIPGFPITEPLPVTGMNSNKFNKIG
jgi:filamentous hemagglutinin family protein